MVQRGAREQADNQLDETLQKLRELARRQEQENERLRRQGSSLQQSGGAAGSRDFRATRIAGSSRRRLLARGTAAMRRAGRNKCGGACSISARSR